VGYAANSVPSVAKQNAMRIMEITRTGAYIIGVRKIIIPMARGIYTMLRL
jgi:hypothetical protein